MNKVYVGLLCVFMAVVAQGQIGTDGMRISNVESYSIAVSEAKSVNLIFPHAVQRVYCPSKELEVEQMKDVKNIILVRSVKAGFTPTNLSVVGVDGRFYSFLLQYAVEPAYLNLKFDVDSSCEESCRIQPIPGSEYSLEPAADKIMQQEKTIRLVNRSQGMKISLDGIFIYKDLMWFNLPVKNSSLINYDVDYVKVFVRDRKRSRKSIVQEREIIPVFSKLNTQVLSDSSGHQVLAFEPFTIPWNKTLVIQMTEKNGGRPLELRALNNVFYKTKKIAD